MNLAPCTQQQEITLTRSSSVAERPRVLRLI